MSDDYPIDYYKKINNEEKHQAIALSEGIRKLYNPSSIVDLGCGTGLYIAPFKDIDYLGIDISEAGRHDAVRQIDANHFRIADLTFPLFTLHKRYDVALCLEVLEHIGNEHTADLMNNLVKTSNILIVSAAPPGQAGLHHVTLEPQEYWNKLFAEKGYKRDYHDEYQLLLPISKVPHTIWIIRNLMVYKKI